MSTDRGAQLYGYTGRHPLKKTNSSGKNLGKGNLRLWSLVLLARILFALPVLWLARSSLLLNALHVTCLQRRNIFNIVRQY